MLHLLRVEETQVMKELEFNAPSLEDLGSFDDI
jgi:hypothetical protein